MKIQHAIFSLSLSLLSLTAFSAEAPPEPCGDLNCSPPMEQIAAKFKEGAGFQWEDLPFLASGDCYHYSPEYNPEKTHHGMVFLDTFEGSAYMGGLFGFFHRENPYKSWTIERARKDLSELYSPNHLVVLEKNFSYSDMNPGKIPIWKYWLKKLGSHLYLIGQWDNYHRVFCEMESQR